MEGVIKKLLKVDLFFCLHIYLGVGAHSKCFLNRGMFDELSLFYL